MNQHSKKLEALNLITLNTNSGNSAENRPVTVVLAKPRTRTPSSNMYLRFDRSSTSFQEIQSA